MKETEGNYSPKFTNKVHNLTSFAGNKNVESNLNRKSSKSEFIDSSYFKYFFVNFGIYLNDSEIKFIFEKFDKNRNNHINYNEFLDSMTNFDLQRQTLIGDFYRQVKNNYNENISFKKLVSLIQPDLHPEVKFLNLSFT
jgi:hypothetical protein